jgi:hypothetical protein
LVVLTAEDPVNSVAIDKRRRNFIVGVELLEGGGGRIDDALMMKILEL